MANTFSQIYIQAVFAVEIRQSLIKPDFKEELQKYMTGIIRKKGQKLIEINCMPDHAHLLIGLKPNIAISDLIRDVKSSSSEFINRKQVIRGRFNWQRRLRGVLLFAIAPRLGDSIHPQSRASPCGKEFQGRIPSPPSKIRRRL